MAENLKVEIKNGTQIHFSVGALIRRGDGILLFDRVRPPYGFAGPAGHMDKDESAETAVIREVYEETGLQVVSTKLLFNEFLPDDVCRHGVIGHQWCLFEVVTSGTLTPDPVEARTMGFYNPKTDEWPRQFEPNWLHWFRKLSIM